MHAYAVNLDLFGIEIDSQVARLDRGLRMTSGTHESVDACNQLVLV